jgi:hypothetical protein
MNPPELYCSECSDHIAKLAPHVILVVDQVVCGRHRSDHECLGDIKAVASSRTTAARLLGLLPNGG